MPRTVLAGLAGVLLLATGCDRTPEPPAPVGVSGRVTDSGGKPVANMMLTFDPSDAENQGQRPMVLLTADGRFQTSCLPGKYTVRLTPLPKAVGHAPDGGVAAPPANTPPGVLQSSWEVNVLSAGREDLQLQVK